MPQPVRFPAPELPVDPVLVTPVEQQHRFWDARPPLAYIRAFAYSRTVAPGALLGAVLCRIAAECGPNIVLPPTIGDFGTLNYFVASVAPPGYGKSAAVKALRPMFDWTVPKTPITTGEGLVTEFARAEKDPDDATWRTVMQTTKCFAVIDEIDRLSALSERAGTTLMPTLRSAWSGEQLGGTTADKSRSVRLEDHTYRLSLIVNVQPRRADALLAAKEADGGTPQRFLWVKAQDPHFPDGSHPAPRGKLPWKRPTALTAPPHIRHEMAVDDGIIEQIREAHRARHRGTMDMTIGDDLDGHLLYLHLKTAALLAILDNRMNVTRDDWRLASYVMAASRSALDETCAVRAAEAQRANEARAAVAAAASVKSEAELQTDAESRAVSSVLNRARRHSAEPGHECRKTCFSNAINKNLRQRVSSSEALALAVESGLLVASHRQSRRAPSEAPVAIYSLPDATSHAQ